MSRVKIGILLLGMALVFVGSVLYYLYGYIDSRWSQDIIIGTIYLGWFIVLFSVAERLNEQAKRIDFRKGYFIGVLQLLAKAAGYICWAALLVANIYVVEKLSEYRVSRILETQPKAMATAIVTGMERRISHGRVQPYAIIEYNTPGGTVKQGIYNCNNVYKTGEILHVFYSVQYPYMFYTETK